MRLNETDKDGVRDYEYERTRQEQVSEQPSLGEISMAEARQHLFEGVKVSEEGRSRTIAVFEALIDSLTSAAARGDPGARAELALLESYQQRKRDVAASKRSYSKSPIRVLEAEHKPMADLGRTLSSWICAQMAPCVFRAFEEANGTIKPSASLLPYYVDKALVDTISNRIRRNQQKKREKDDYEIGYRKPPVSTRFSKDRNPRGKALPVDIWDKLDLSYRKSVVVTASGGKTIASTRHAISFVQLFRDAIKGKRRARAETRKIIIQLDQKGMLSPPDRRRRAKRNLQKMTIEQQLLLKSFEIRIAPSIKRDLVDCFSRRFGAVPDFVTAYERQLSAILKTKEWRTVEAWLAERDAQTSPQIRPELGERHAVVEATPITATQPRKRTTPVSRGSTDSTLHPSAAPSAGTKRPRARSAIRPPKSTTAVGGKPSRLD